MHQTYPFKPTPWMRRIWGKLLWVRYLLFHRHRYDSLILEHVREIPLLVLPTVLNPVLMQSGAYFANILTEHALFRQKTGGIKSALDVGTGSGVLALFACAHAERVVAVDINPEAVRCARINALLNKLDHKLEVRQGDLFAPADGEQFDLILFNPPWYIGKPKDWLDYAWRGEEIAQRFADGLLTHLAADGMALILLSTKGAPGPFLDALAERNLITSVFAERELINEYLTCYQVVHSTAN